MALGLGGRGWRRWAKATAAIFQLGGRRSFGRGGGAEQAPQGHLMLQPAEGEGAIGHEQPLHQFPLQRRRLQRFAQQTARGQGIQPGARHTMAVAEGGCRGNGAQQGFMALRQGLPVGADDVQGARRALGSTILIARLGGRDDDQGGALSGAGLVEQLLCFALVFVMGIGI